ALEVRKALRVDEHAYAVRFVFDVVGAALVGKFQLIRQARAARGLDADAQSDALPAPLERARHVARRRFGQMHSLHRLCHSVPRCRAPRYALRLRASPAASARDATAACLKAS